MQFKENSEYPIFELFEFSNFKVPQQQATGCNKFCNKLLCWGMENEPPDPNNANNEQPNQWFNLGPQLHFNVSGMMKSLDEDMNFINWVKCCLYLTNRSKAFPLHLPFGNVLRRHFRWCAFRLSIKYEMFKYWIFWISLKLHIKRHDMTFDSWLDS